MKKLLLGIPLLMSFSSLAHYCGIEITSNSLDTTDADFIYDLDQIVDKKDFVIIDPKWSEPVYTLSLDVINRRNRRYFKPVGLKATLSSNFDKKVLATSRVKGKAIIGKNKLKRSMRLSKKAVRKIMRKVKVCN